MYSISLRLAASSTGSLVFGLRRFGGAGAVVPAVAGFAIPSRGRRRSVSATPSAGAPLPGEQGVGMEPPKQQQPQVPQQDAARVDEKQHDADGFMYSTNNGTRARDVMTHSFGAGYATRSDEEGLGGVYGGNDNPVENPGAERIHPSHPEYDTS